MKSLHNCDLNKDDLCQKSDSDLAEIAKNNRVAAAVLVSRFSRLIYVKAGIFSGTTADFDDLSQEGLMGLLSAINTFDPVRGVKFSTYAEVCIVNRMKTFAAKGFRKAAKESEIEELSELRSAVDHQTPESIFLYKEYFSELMTNINDVLSAAESRVFSLCVSGMSYKAASKKLGISEKSVDNAMQRARRKIRELLREQENL